MTNRTTPNAGDLLATLRITRIERPQFGASWVSGTIAGHSFDAKVYPEYAEVAGYELDDSRISKLWPREIASGNAVATFDRGWDRQPTTDAARTIVDLLAAGLAELIYGN